MSSKQRKLELGCKINHWTVISLDDIRSGRRKFFICECKCGNKVSKRSDELVTDGPKQCKKCDKKRQNNGTILTTHIDLRGQKIGRWTVLEREISSKHCCWKCQCECGSMNRVSGGNLRKNKPSQCHSCASKTRKITSHGSARRGKMSQEYRTWAKMKERCLNPSIKYFNNWGGRGITICKEWIDSFESFFAYVGKKPSTKHSLDRINNDGNYEPGNVRWATAKEQANNRRAKSEHPR